MEGSEPLSVVRPIKRSRASRPKVKTGCRTCKLRGVKCDEEKPTCRRCVSTGRVCDGYGIWGVGGNTYGSAERASNMRFSKITMLLNTPFVGCEISQQEKMAFDYFRTRTSVKLPGLFGSTFWENLVFLASSREPAVLHALITLGAIHLSKATEDDLGSIRNDTQSMNQYDRLALQQYNKSIGHLGIHFTRKDKESNQVALITCLVFVCVELVRKNFKTAHTHTNSGLNLLGEVTCQGRTSQGPGFLMLRSEPGSVEDYLIEAFSRFSIHSTTLFGGDRSSLVYGARGYEERCGPDTAYETPSRFDTFREGALGSR